MGQPGNELRSNGKALHYCLFYEQATFVTNFFTQDFPTLNLKAGTDYDYFGHPSMGNSQFDNNVNFFYDNVAVYNDKPAVRKLMQYLSTAQAQQIWANDGGTLGAIKSLTYTDPLRPEQPTARSSAAIPPAAAICPARNVSSWAQAKLGESLN